MIIELSESPSCNLMTLEGSFFKAQKTNHDYIYTEKNFLFLGIKKNSWLYQEESLCQN